MFSPTVRMRGSATSAARRRRLPPQGRRPRCSAGDRALATGGTRPLRRRAALGPAAARSPGSGSLPVGTRSKPSWPPAAGPEPAGTRLMTSTNSPGDGPRSRGGERGSHALLHRPHALRRRELVHLLVQLLDPLDEDVRVRVLQHLVARRGELRTESSSSAVVRSRESSPSCFSTSATRCVSNSCRSSSAARSSSKCAAICARFRRPSPTAAPAAPSGRRRRSPSAPSARRAGPCARAAWTAATRRRAAGSRMSPRCAPSSRHQEQTGRPPVESTASEPAARRLPAAREGHLQASDSVSPSWSAHVRSNAPSSSFQSCDAAQV